MGKAHRNKAVQSETMTIEPAFVFLCGIPKTPGPECIPRTPARIHLAMIISWNPESLASADAFHMFTDIQDIYPPLSSSRTTLLCT